jgi:inosine-uridine nucleoside N-ribohydrolase
MLQAGVLAVPRVGNILRSAPNLNRFVLERVGRSIRSRPSQCTGLLKDGPQKHKLCAREKTVTLSDWKSNMKKHPARILFFLIVAMALVAACPTTVGAAAQSHTPSKIIFDTDPGTDDAMALLLALHSPELDVKAITVVPGNVTAEMGLENALKLVSLAGRCDIPVAGGARKPLFQKLITAQFWHGKNGLGNVELPPPTCHAESRFGPDLIIEFIHKYPHEITLVPVGPETNIAMAVLKDPSIVPLVKEVIVMGGSISGGNVNAAAEANIFNDPEAAQIVFNAGWPVTLVGLDVGDRTLMTRPLIAELAKTHGRENDFAVGVLNYLIDLSEKYGAKGIPMYDPLAVGAAIDVSIITTQDMNVNVETRGEFTRGETVANRHNMQEHNVLHGDHYEIEGAEVLKPNVKVAVEVDAVRFLKLFIDRVAGK